MTAPFKTDTLGIISLNEENTQPTMCVVAKTYFTTRGQNEGHDWKAHEQQPKYDDPKINQATPHFSAVAVSLADFAQFQYVRPDRIQSNWHSTHACRYNSVYSFSMRRVQNRGALERIVSRMIATQPRGTSSRSR